MSGILVLGSLNMDLVVRSPRLPQSGETVLGGPFATFPGGKGANQAVAAARLGARVSMVGRVGRDVYGVDLRDALAAQGVDASAVRALAGEETGVALITVAEDGENTIVVAPGANALLDEDDVARVQEVQAGDLLLCQLEVPIESVARALRIARDAGAHTILNAAPAAALDRGVVELADVLVTNLGEAALLADMDDRDDPADLAIALCSRGCDTAVVTLGAGGALAFDGERMLRQPSFPVEVVDAVAAGDAFTAALAVRLGEGAELAEALAFACAAGALATTRAGAQPSLPERRVVDALVAGSGIR